MDCRLERRLVDHYLVVLLISGMLMVALPLPTVGARSTNNFFPGQLTALVNLSQAWHQGSPKPKGYLPGWTNESDTDQIQPCYNEHGDNWEGVQCLRLRNSASDSSQDEYEVRVTGLILRAASIEGELPQQLWHLQILSTVILTGNPKLTGSLPVDDIAWNTDSLYTLTLSDNGLSGEIPYELSLCSYLADLDLSSNHFGGNLTLNFRNMSSLRTLILSNNLLSGVIPSDSFESSNQLVTLDLSNNYFSGQIPTLPSGSSLQTMNLSANLFTDVPAHFYAGFNNLSTAPAVENMDLSHSLFSPPSSTTLDLSHNNITTNISLWDVMIFVYWQNIYLDYNNIDGTLDVDHLSTMMNLSRSAWNCSDDNYFSPCPRSIGIVSMTFNQITQVSYTGEYPTNFIIRSIFGGLGQITLEENLSITSIHCNFGHCDLRLEGNPYCNTTNSDTTAWFLQSCFCSRTSPNLENRKIIIIATSMSISVLCFGLLLGNFLFSKFKRDFQCKLEKDLQQLLQQKCDEYDVKPTIFKYDELHNATQGFHTNMKLGEGGFGVVYKGILPNKTVVAVKKMFIKHEQGIGDFCNEVALITEMRHRNLVKLKGCCLRESQRLLVYEYMENYDLHQALLEGKCVDMMDWPIRFKICVGVARGLHYLHALAEPRIIHRDIKANNILLDKDFQPKIADFGLALLFPDEKTHIMASTVAGTKGYLAPEYATMGQLSEKADVYSFGVVLLEVVSGRKNIDFSKPEDQEYLIKWAWMLHEDGNLKDLIDPKLHLDESKQQEAQQVINVALLCLQFSDVKRPTMAHVVTMLHLENVAAMPERGSGVKLGRESSMLRELMSSCSFGSALTPIKEEHEIPLFGASSSSTSEGGSSSSVARRGLELRRVQSK